MKRVAVLLVMLSLTLMCVSCKKKDTPSGADIDKGPRSTPAAEQRARSTKSAQKMSATIPTKSTATVNIALVNTSEVKLSISLTFKKDNTKTEYELALGATKTISLKLGAYDALYSYYGGPSSFRYTSESVYVKNQEKWIFSFGDLGWSRVATP